ncbi:MAG: efflux RND transporter periplasmic adaptor subunit [Bacteroidales bacterium]
MKREVLLLGIAFILIAATFFILKKTSKKGTDIIFETAEVLKGKITSTVTATGTVEAITTVKVGTQVSGILKGVYADFNDIVKKGQLLAKLDETALRAQVEQSQALVDQAQAQLNYNESTFTRLKALHEMNLVAQADYDLALYNYENSKSALVNSLSNLSRSRVNLDYATITSPIDGVVLNRAVEEGQTVAASFNTPELFTIVNDLTRMEVKTSVDEADIGKVKTGQRVEFSVDAYPDLLFEGTVSEVRLQPVITSNVVTYNVILDAPNPEKKLMPGMTASSIIYVDEKDEALFVMSKAFMFRPDTALIGEITFPDQAEPNQLPGKSRIIWIRDEKSGLQPRRVKTGIDNGLVVEILSGLSEGENVVVSAISNRDRQSSSGSVREGLGIKPAGMAGNGG